jgi:arylsulfatase
MNCNRTYSVTAVLPWAVRSLPAAIMALSMLLGVAACRRPQTAEDLGAINDLRPLIDRFSPASPVVVVPDRFWETDADGQSWVFRGYANLVCYVDRRPEMSLEIALQPTVETSEFHFVVSWDGEKLWPAPRRLAHPVEVLVISQDRLSRGLHRLEIRRVAAADDPEDRTRRNNGFDVVEYRLGEDVSRLEPSAADRHELVRAFLEDGVTGVGKEKRNGWLANGMTSATAALTLTEAGVASFTVASLDAGPSRFSVFVDGDELSVDVSSDPESLEFELSAGTHRLEFLVRGAPDGYYLWGTPHLLPVSPTTAGPVIVVTMDTTRWDSLSIHGGPPDASPNIARLASHATVFDNAWSTSPWTLPSHASIFTGLYPSHHGAGVTKPRLTRDFTTLAEIFRQAGYRTAGFAGGELSASYWGVAQGFELYRDPEGFETRGDRLTGFVEEHLETVAGEPFFLFVNYFDPHGLYQAPAEFEELFGVAELRERIHEAPLWGELSRGDSRVWRAIIGGEAEVTADAVAYVRAAYLAEVAFMDHQVGRLIDRLEDRGLFDAATIVLLADHGEFLGEHGFFSHACRLDPELTRVPLMIKWPHQIEPRRDHSLVSQVDLFGTLAGIAGPAVAVGDGLSLEGVPRPDLVKRSAVFMEEHEMRIHPLFDNMKIAPSIFGIQQADFRQEVWRGGTTCYRRRGSAWSEARCTVDWPARLEELEASINHPVGSPEAVGESDLSDEMRQRLEALGYIQ